MKKVVLVVLISILCFIPFSVSAKDYKSLNLDEALKEEGIDHDFSNYEETSDQAIIYLFRGNGCSYCKKFLTFLNSIVDDYGKYFKVVSYEVWYDSNNAELMNKVGDFLGTKANGVPYIVIGNEVFPGYAESYDDQIKEAIKNEYDAKNANDVMQKLSISVNKTTSTSDIDNKNTKILSTVLLSIFGSVVVIGSIIIIIVFNIKDKKENNGE